MEYLGLLGYHGESSFDRWSSDIVTREMSTAHRDRHLDLTMSRETRETFITRAKIISTIRNFLGERGFLEVETPMLHDIPGRI